MASVVIAAGIFSSANSVLGLTAVVTATAAGMARYVVVLTEADRRRVERATAYGFHLGMLASAALFAIDQALG